MIDELYVSSSDRECQYQIYTLFLTADGQWTASEQKLLETVAEKMDLSAEVRTRSEMLCCALGGVLPDEKRLENQRTDNSGILIKKIESLLDSCPAYSDLRCNVRLQAETLWTLINLGYADTDFSAPEKKIINALAQRWKINLALLNELIDTAETIRYLVERMDALKALPFSSAGNARLKALKTKVQRMAENVRVTLGECDLLPSNEHGNKDGDDLQSVLEKLFN